MAEKKKPKLTEAQKQELRGAEKRATADLVKHAKETISQAAQVHAIASYAKEQLRNGGDLSEEEKTNIDITSQKYDKILEGTLTALKTIAKGMKVSDKEIKGFSEGFANTQQEVTKEGIRAGKFNGAVGAMKEGLRNGTLVSHAELARADAAFMEAGRQRGLIEEVKDFIRPQAINDYVAVHLTAEAEKGTYGPSVVKAIDAIGKLAPSAEYHKKYEEFLHDIQTRNNNPKTFLNIITTAEKEVEAEIKDKKIHEEKIAKINAGIEAEIGPIPAKSSAMAKSQNTIPVPQPSITDEPGRAPEAKAEDDKEENKRKLIAEARTALKKVAMGSGRNSELTKALENLSEKHGLGPEALDHDFDDPSKPHKTREQMEEVVNYSMKAGSTLFKARRALNGIASGAVDVTEGIKTINEQLRPLGFDYGALDVKFDPNDPNAPHKSSAEMKDEIKAAVVKGNKNREGLIEFLENGKKSIRDSGSVVPEFKEYSKPQSDLNIDNLLNLPAVKDSSLYRPAASSFVGDYPTEIKPTQQLQQVIIRTEKAPSALSVEPKETKTMTKEEPRPPLNNGGLGAILGALQELRSPEEQLKTAMLEDRIKQVAVKRLEQEKPNLSHENRQALNKFAMYDGKIGEISDKFTNREDFLKAHEIAQGEIYDDIKSGRYDTLIRNKMKEAYEFIGIAAPLRHVQIKDADFRLPYDIKQTALKEAEALLGNPDAKTDQAANAVLAEAAKITKDGDKSPDVVASYLIAKTITQPTLCHDHHDIGKQVILVNVGEPSKETIKRHNKDDKFVFEAAMQIFGDNFPQYIKGGVDTMGPQGDRPYIEAANKTEIGGRCK